MKSLVWIVVLLLQRLCHGQTFPIRINCGATQDTTCTDGPNTIVWSADFGYSQDVTSRPGTTEGSVANSKCDEIFQVERVFYDVPSGAKYTFSVPNGVYTVRLLFSEIWFTSANNRIFSVDLQGSRLCTDFDPFVSGDNAKNSASFMQGIAQVTDGTLEIELTPLPGKNWAQINAIEIFDGEPTATSALEAICGQDPTSPPSAPSASSAPTATPIPPTPSPTAPSAPTAPTQPTQPTEAPTGPTPNPTDAPPLIPAIRIDCGRGGGEYIDSEGNVWISDVGFFSQGVPGIGSDAISNTLDDEIYQSERFAQNGGNIVYTFNNMFNTRYDINLLFAEFWFTAAGQRVFSIAIQDEVEKSNFDVLTEADHDEAYILSVTEVEVTAGTLKIELIQVTENPKINGIEIKQSESAVSEASLSLYINCGEYGSNLIDSNGNLWFADIYETSSGTSGISTNNAITIPATVTPSNTAPLYQYARTAPAGQSIEYSIPLTEFGTSERGVYDVTLYFAEIELNGAGARLMDVEMEGQVRLTGLDVYNVAPMKDVAYKFVEPSVTVLDGFLDIKITATQGQPFLSALSLNQASDHFAHSVIVVDDVGVLVFEDLVGTELVEVILDGSPSHTHYTGAQLVKWVWTWQGITSAGTSYEGSASGETVTASIPTGVYTLNLAVLDDFNFADALDVTLTILPHDGYPGCLTYYYNFNSLDPLPGMPDFESISSASILPLEFVVEPMINFAESTNDEPLGQSRLSSNFAAEFVCYFEITQADTYGLALESNDGARLYIDDTEIVRIDGVQPDTTVTKAGADYTFSVGQHRVLVQYFDSVQSQNKALKLFWTPPGQSEEVVPASELFYALDQRKSLILSIFPTGGTIDGGTTVTLNGLDFLWSPDTMSIIIETEEGEIVINENGVNWSPESTASFSFVMPEYTLGPKANDVPAKVFLRTPAGLSNAVDFVYQAKAFDPPAWYGAVNMASNGGYTSLDFGPDGKLYAATVQGTIARWELSFDHTSNPPSYSIVNELVSNAVPQSLGFGVALLGLSFDPNDPVMGEDGEGPIIYVSASQLFHGEAFDDKLGWIFAVSGANMEIVEPVVSYLPVSDHDHAINGITFGANGIMYVAIGGNTNAGVPGALTSQQIQEEKYFSACILGVNKNQNGFNGTLIYDDKGEFPLSFSNGVFIQSAGMRNPFDVEYHPKYNSLYASDNGPNESFGQEQIDCDTIGPDPGGPDKLVKADYGDYFGHPNKLRGSMTGFERECTYRSYSEPSDEDYEQQLGTYPSSSDGVAVYYTNTFGAQWKESLIIGKFVGSMHRAILDETKGGAALLASEEMDDTYFQHGLGVVVDYRGSVFLADVSGGLLRYIVPNDDINQYEIPYVISVFPHMGPETGGREIIIRGYKFGNEADTTVTFGTPDGPQCQDISMGQMDEFDSITCITPDYTAYQSETLGAVKMYVYTDGQLFIAQTAYTFTTKLAETPKSGQNGWITREDTPKTLLYSSAAPAPDGTGFYYWAGLQTDGTFNDDVHFYEYDRDQWSLKTATANNLRNSGQTQQSSENGNIYVFGGNGETSHQMKAYDVEADSWTILNALVVDADGLATDWKPQRAVSGLVGNVMYVAGGQENSVGVSDRVFAYDIGLDQWSEVSSLPAARWAASSAVADGVFYVFGGKDVSGQAQNSVFSLDTSVPDAQWVTRTNMPEAVSDTGAAIEMDGKLVVVGGNSDGSVQSFDPSTDTWTNLERDMITPRVGSVAVKRDNTVHVVGGNQVSTGSGSIEHELLVFL